MPTRTFEAAIAAYDAALSIQPDDHQALNNKGFALYESGRYEEAIAAYDAALSIQPDYHQALNNKGIALDDLGRYEEAIAAYDAALSIQPDLPPSPLQQRHCAETIRPATKRPSPPMTPLCRSNRTTTKPSTTRALR